LERMTLLQQMDQDRAEERETLRLEVRRQLRLVLLELLPAARLWIFGSLTRPGGFQQASDVDLALEGEPAGMSIYQLTALLSERLGRSVDVVLLPECRFRDKILREGELWTLRD
jgi:predicted nucleotidyltransferase